MINCQFENLRDVLDNKGDKIGEIFETFKCDDDPAMFQTFTKDDQIFRAYKRFDAGDVIVFWFGVAITVAWLTLFVIKWVRNKNVF